MKKSIFSKILSVILASATLLTLASCSAMDEKSDNMAADGLYYDDIGETGSTPPSEIAPEEYGKLIENEWISTADEPTSTFSSDVDTASYTRFRAFVNQNASLNTCRTTTARQSAPKKCSTISNTPQTHPSVTICSVCVPRSLLAHGTIAQAFL